MGAVDCGERRRFRIKDPFCGISHGLGAVLSAAGMLTLLALAHGRPRLTVGFAVYGVSLILLYSASALYHSLTVGECHLRRLQRCDYIGIFLLIAGTYTPVCLVALRGAWGWSLLGAEWGMAALGIAGIVLLRQMPAWLRVVLYIVMGWLAIIALGPLRQHLSPTALSWLLAGGIAYTIGTIFYATEWPNLWPGKFEAHDLWHVFVLAGSACHFVLMLCLV